MMVTLICDGRFARSRVRTRAERLRARGSCVPLAPAPARRRAMDSDSEDFVVVGTSLEREEASRSYRQKKPSASALATTKALPAHLQVPTDAEGRRRFHGAFEGGFSAGYHNTVGSKEGWAPSAFRSSRGDRAPANDERSRAEAYMDDDEREAAQAARLEATDAFDTFGEGAMRKAQRQFAGVAGPSRDRGGGGIIPGPVPGDLVVAVAHPAAQRLLRRMGWRPGKGVGRRRTTRKAQTEGTDEGSLKGEEGEQIDASVRVEFVREDLIDDALIPEAPAAKLDRHGFGYDPFEDAEEFRALAESRRRDRDAHPRGLRAGNAPARGEAFGVGVFEDPDEDAAAFFADDKSRDDVGHFYEIPESASDSDSRSEDGDATRASAAVAARLGLRNTGRVKPLSEETPRTRDGVRGFVVSKHTLAPTKWYPPPAVPRGFDARHAFPDENAAPAPPKRLDDERTAERPTTDETHTDTRTGLFLSQPPPPPPPSDAQTKTFIDTTAHFVAKNGAWFETMVREKRGADARFAFLFPDEKKNTDDSRYSRYYAWRLRTSRLELARNAGDAAAWAARTRTRAIADIAARRRPLDADDRARALGETPLKRTALFEKPQKPGAAASVAAFGVDAAAVAAGDRTRIASALSGAFTPGVVEGGGDVRGDIGETRNAETRNALPAGLTDAASLVARRAAEREKAAARAEAERAAAAAREAAAPMVAARTSRDWAPAALLCKRFGVPDPFELGDGRARPVEAPPALVGVSSGERERKDAAKEKKARKTVLDAPSSDKRGETLPTTLPVTEVPPPPPIPPSRVSDEAEAFLRGLFFKKQIFEDSDDEAEAERRADRAEEEASRARRAAEETAAAPPPPPPMLPPLPRPDAARKRARAEPEPEPEPADLSAPVDEDPSAAASRKRRKKEKRREKKKAKARRREKKAKKEKSGKKRRRSRRRGSSDSSDSSGSSSDESDDG